jgi:hypothetical protein
MFGRLMVERMLRAAVASMAAYVSVGIANTPLSATGLRALGVGTVGAGVSACFTLVSQFFGDPNSTSFTKASVVANPAAPRDGGGNR